jgi:putative hemolysin
MNDGEQEFDTLAGFILHELKHIPTTGETFEWRGFSFEIVDMDGHRIDKVIVAISQKLKDEIEENET